MNKNEIFKKVGSIAVLSTMLLSNNLVLAKSNNFKSTTQVKTNNEITVMYNGEKIEFDQQPIIENDRTKVPFRKVFESMGCIVYYNNNENKIMALTKEGNILTHTIGTNEFQMNGEVKTFDSSSSIVNDRTLIPLRAVAEILNSKVDWDNKTQTVTIEKEEKQLDNIEKEIMMHVLDINYNPKDTKRYVEYKRNHQDLSIEQVIMDVNMDLDKELVEVIDNGIVLNYHGLKYMFPKEEDVEVIEDPDDILAYSNKFNKYPDDYEPKDLQNAYTNETLKDEFKYNGSNLFEEFIRQETNQAYQEMCNAYIIENGFTSDSNKIIKNMIIYFGYTNVQEMKNNIGNMKQIAVQKLGIEIGSDYICKRFENYDTGKLRSGNALYIATTPLAPQQYLSYKQQFYPLNDGEIEQLNASNQIYNINGKVELINWITQNCYRFGFCQPYLETNQHISHMDPTPYLLVYLGKDATQKMHDEYLDYDTFHAKYVNPVVNSKKYSIEKSSTQKVLSKY